MRLKSVLIPSMLMIALPGLAQAATYTVGPSGKQYTQLSAVFSSKNLNPGDIIEVEGNATYTGGIVVGSDDSGTAASPVIIRWRPGSTGTRPVLQGGTNTIKFQQSNNIVFEGFDVRGGSNTCIFSEADNVTVRDAVIHDCPGHGILAADQLSGSFTLEYSEIYNAGASSNRHPIYMQSDEVAFPNAVFKMRFNYLHNGIGGNLVKVRHQRSEIYYNWLEGSAYQALEFIGPDCYEQQAGWTANLKREDADVVGNVIVQSGSWPNAVRMGGDLNGRSQGRVRMVNNTILFTRSGAANAVMVQLGAESLEMHNNIVYQTTAGGKPTMVKENVVDDTPEPCSPQSTSPWSSGRKVAGSYNWVQTGAVVPSEWRNTLTGSNPGLTNAAAYSLRPLSTSLLVGAGANPPAVTTAFPFPSPLAIPLYDPPVRAKLAPAAAKTRALAASRISVGAFEVTAGGTPRQTIRVAGSQPLLTGTTGATAVAAQAMPASTSTIDSGVADSSGPSTGGKFRNRGAGFRKYAKATLADGSVRTCQLGETGLVCRQDR